MLNLILILFTFIFANNMALDTRMMNSYGSRTSNSIPFVKADTLLNTLTQAETDGGWVLLFNGSVEGWRGVHKETFPQHCRITVMVSGTGISRSESYSYQLPYNSDKNITINHHG